MAKAALLLMLMSLASVCCSQGTDAHLVAAKPAIEVFVDATAKHGVLANPDPSKLTITVDGKPAQLLSSRPAKEDKLLFALMVDISSSGRTEQEAIKDAAAKIFQALSSEKSQGYLVLFNVQTFSTKKPVSPSEAQLILDHVSFSRGTSLYDSVAEMASSILSRSANPDTPRRLIIVLSDGNDNYSKITADAMVATVQREGVPVFFLAQSSPNPSHSVMYVSEQFGLDTGGAAVKVDSMPDGVPALIAAVQGQLELTITSQQVARGGLHSLSVKSSEKGISIAAPARIFVP